MPVPRTVVRWALNEINREDFRRAVLTKWATERSGTAESFQRYRYNVELCSDGTQIFLTRPAWKNKGCDFVVNCDPHLPPALGGKRHPPTHADLINELAKLAENTAERIAVLAAAQEVYDCVNINAVCKKLKTHLADEKHSFAERALKIAKWLFIEQDITDWNTSGRAMLMNGIRERLSVGT